MEFVYVVNIKIVKKIIDGKYKPKTDLDLGYHSIRIKVKIRYQISKYVYTYIRISWDSVINTFVTIKAYKRKIYFEFKSFDFKFIKWVFT